MRESVFGLLLVGCALAAPGAAAQDKAMCQGYRDTIAAYDGSSTLLEPEPEVVRNNCANWRADKCPGEEPASCTQIKVPEDMTDRKKQ